MIVRLAEIADVHLGYKSLQNDFFYVNQATVESFRIEKQFLKPIHMLKEMDPQSFKQTLDSTVSLFFCSKKEADLRGTGALRYIQSMSVRPANQRKQSSKVQTMQQALEAQGGGLWYAPKALPHDHHIWLRKAMSGTYAPFIFEKPSLVDQRCNSIVPISGHWKLLAAVLSSSLFAYSLEINGSSAMGAGALEAPTTKLRDYPVVDIRKLDGEEATLIELAKAVWDSEEPIDWSSKTPSVGKSQRCLDKWLLERLATKVALDTMYSDLHHSCQSRILLASDKVSTTKSKKSDNINSVALAIAAQVRPKFSLKNFPEDFYKQSTNDVDIEISRDLVRQINLTHFLGETELSITDGAGNQMHHNHYCTVVAEAIARAVLSGRSSFRTSLNRETMERAVSGYLEWLVAFNNSIEDAIRSSAFGTGYEDILRTEVYSALNLSPMICLQSLPNQILLADTKS